MRRLTEVTANRLFSPVFAIVSLSRLRTGGSVLHLLLTWAKNRSVLIFSRHNTQTAKKLVVQKMVNLSCFFNSTVFKNSFQEYLVKALSINPQFILGIFLPQGGVFYRRQICTNVYSPENALSELKFLLRTSKSKKTRRPAVRSINSDRQF